MLEYFSNPEGGPLNKHDDVIYMALRGRCIEACEMISNLTKFQASDRKALKIETNSKLKQSIRHRLASRRSGKNGLRALNNAIRHFYQYCKDMGY